MKNVSYNTRISWIRKTILFFFLIGIGLSYKLWTSERLFPLLPVFDWIPSFIFPIDCIFLFTLILLLGINLFYWNHRINLIVLSILLLLFMQDQNRWQPWAYIYFLFLTFFSFSGKTACKDENLLFYFRFITMGIYLWSGIHKLNTHFIDETFESILTDFLCFKDLQLIDTIKPWGYVIPVVEISISIFLFFPKCRSIGVYLAILVHLFILLYLSPLGVNNNSVVYPWNVAMIFMVFLLFYQTHDKIRLHRLEQLDVGTLVLTCLIYVLPLFNFFGCWDNYLSFSLYSNKVDNYSIVIADTQLDKVDKRLAPYYLSIEGLTGGKIIDVGKWSAEELNVPFYPERRTFKKIAKTFCKLGIPDDQLYFLELNSSEKGKYIRYTCTNLK